MGINGDGNPVTHMIWGLSPESPLDGVSESSLARFKDDPFGDGRLCATPALYLHQ